MEEMAAANPSKWRRFRLSGAKSGLGKAELGHSAMQDAERMGITSLPGTIKTLRREGARKVLRTAWGSQVGGMSTNQKALLFGVPAGIGLAGAATAKPGERGEAVGESAGLTASNVLPMAMSPSMIGNFSPAAHLMPTFLMSRPFMWAGKQVGRGADWALQKARSEP
jgi:hypothetical protein